MINEKKNTQIKFASIEQRRNSITIFFIYKKKETLKLCQLIFEKIKNKKPLKLSKSY
jgi:hypothetical protein